MWRCGEKTGSDFHKKIKAGGEIGKGRQKKTTATTTGIDRSSAA